MRNLAEIGSEYWLEQAPEEPFEECDGVYVLSGRTAIDLILQDILKKSTVRNVFMPAWCCDSMLAPFVSRGIDVRFYDVSFRTQTDTNEQKISINVSLLNTNDTDKTDIFYLTNYFGYENTLPIDTVMRIKEKGTIILYDRTHSFLMEDTLYQEIANYTFASIRKWMGVVGGAVVNGLAEKPMLKGCPYSSIKERAMREKCRYVKNDNHVDKKNFLNDFVEFGHHLADDYQDYEMDKLSFAIYKQEDFKAMARKRKENAAYLHANLKGVKYIGQLTDDAVPLFVPIFFENKEKRDMVRKVLIENQIYCPIHWPKPQQIPTSFAVNQIVDTELSLICDQRYGLTEMDRIVTQISKYN